MRLASLGSSDMDTGVAQITDEAIKAQVQKQAKQAGVKSLAGAAVLTAVAMLL
jgi:hypothetical protein